MVGDREAPSWDEAVPQERDVAIAVDEIADGACYVPVTVGSASQVDEVAGGGSVVRERQALTGRMRVSAQRLTGVRGGFRVRVSVHNITRCADLVRDSALRHSFVAAHLLLGVTEGAFVSMLDPPQWARAAVDQCRNEHTWPVLLDTPDTMLSSPVVRYDHPAIPEQRPSRLCGGVEIDEVPTLPTLELTDRERREAGGTGERPGELISAVENLSAEAVASLHATTRRAADAETTVPQWVAGADAVVCPDTDRIRIGGVVVARGSKVVLNPGRHRAEGQAMFLTGRSATVRGVFLDVDDEQYVAVTLDDDPAAEVQGTRLRYFLADEVLPAGTSGESGMST